MSNSYLIEEWAHIPNFTGYVVSNFGQVLNLKTDRILEQSPVQGGALRVNLIGSDGIPRSRSVKVIVAEAFVPKLYSYFDTPIQLDNHFLNVRADNLAWRTRAFAWTYKHQFSGNMTIHDFGPLLDIDNNVLYKDVYDVATENGLLFKDVWRCINGLITSIPPTNQRIVAARHSQTI